MVKEEPVSIRRQTIYAIIPILDLYATYKVKRLRKYLLIMILVLIPVGIADSVLFPVPEIDETFEDIEISDMFFYGYDTNHIVAFIVEEIGFVLLAIYLVRRWSKQWNKKFESSP